ncbi:MAG: TonB family protein [Pseudomonadota bacterium]
MNQLIRISISLCVAVLLVGSLAMFGVNTYFQKPPVNNVEAFRVETATVEEIEAALGRTPEPPPPEPPPYERERERDGFVQVQFAVTPGGRAEDATVVGAMPAGYFEDQALAQINRRRFVPDRVDGEAVRSVRTEIVEFKYLPAQTRAVGTPE